MQSKPSLLQVPEPMQRMSSVRSQKSIGGGANPFLMPRTNSQASSVRSGSIQTRQQPLKFLRGESYMTNKSKDNDPLMGSKFASWFRPGGVKLSDLNPMAAASAPRDCL